MVLSDGRQQVRVSPEPEVVYDLGNVLFVDRVLFTETSDVVRVMENFQGERLVAEDEEVARKEEEEVVEDFGKPTASSDLKSLPDKKAVVEVEKVRHSAEEFAAKDVAESPEESTSTKVSFIVPASAAHDAEGPPRSTRKEDEEDPASSPSLLLFPSEEDWDSDQVEEKVIFVNNKKISILTHKQTTRTEQ